MKDDRKNAPVGFTIETGDDEINAVGMSGENNAPDNLASARTETDDADLVVVSERTEGGAGGKENAPRREKTPRASLTEKEKANREAERAFRRLTSIDDQPHFNNSLRALLGGDLLAGKWFRQHVLYILFLVFLTLVYVSARYSCQQAMIEQKQLQDSLLDRRYKALTRSAQLKEKTRRSYIEENLQDTTLQTASTPSFNLKVEKEN